LQWSVYIDDELSWSDHITNLEKTNSRSVGIFYRIRHYLNERAFKSLYFSNSSGSQTGGKLPPGGNMQFFEV